MPMLGTLCSLSQDTKAQEHQDFPLGLEAVKVPEDLKFKQQDEHNQVLLRIEEQVGESRQGYVSV